MDETLEQRVKKKGLGKDISWRSRSKTGFMDRLHLVEALEEPLLLLVVFRDFALLPYIEENRG